MKNEFFSFVLIGLLACLPAGAAELETARWQAAIDAAGARGGGVVTIPAGRHLVGQLDLRSNVELHLEDDAVLEGAVGMVHYRRTVLPYSEGTWSAVVFALGVTNVAVTGRGTIFGNGVPWETPKSGGGNQEGLRPRGLFFGNAVRIRLSDFTLRDAACWGIVLKCCDGVDIRRVRVDNHANHNNDGIDIEAKNVVIADCDIDSGDDAIVLKANDPHFAVENVLVTNVTAKSYCNCLKFGTASHGIMRNVLFVDCRTGAPRRDFEDRVHGGGSWYFNNARRNARFPGSVPGYAEASSGITVQNVDGGIIENVVYRNITVEGVRVPIFIRGGARTGRDCGTPPSEMRTLRNILIENVRGTAGSWVASSITGVRSCRVRDVTLRNVHIVCKGAGDCAAERTRPVPENEGNYPDPDIFRCMLPAWGLYVRHVDGLALENVTFELRGGETDARERFVLDDVTNFFEGEAAKGEGKGG